jgi:SAM-dependent methyltransferase
LANVTVEKSDLEDPETYDDLAGFDSVVCINVLEHLDHPDRALAGFWRALRPGGAALVLVPAHGWLFSAADQAIEHRKRYEESDLTAELEEAGFQVESVEQFNRLGVLGWWVNKQWGRTSISPWQARIFSMLMPLARLVERLDALPGLSLLAVARKPE